MTESRVYRAVPAERHGRRSMTTLDQAKAIEILMVEDNLADVRLTQVALRDARVCNTLNHVPDGEEAMRYLRREGAYTTASMPDIVLLDLNMPKKDGREVLEEIRADPRLTHLPVIVLTTSEADEDILKSYGLHANSYVVKPLGLDEFIQVIRGLEDYWLCLVKLPTRPA